MQDESDRQTRNTHFASNFILKAINLRSKCENVSISKVQFHLAQPTLILLTAEPRRVKAIERFRVTLSGAMGASLTTAFANGIIRNDD
jgi:hypothetical protein